MVDQVPAATNESLIGATCAVTVPVATLWTSREAPRDVDRPALLVPAEMRDWLGALDTPARLDLHGRVDSQVLLGEHVVVDAAAGEWVRVVVPGQPSTLDARGYPGWLPARQLTPVSAARPRGARAVLTALTTDAYDEPDGTPVMRDVSFGTVLDTVDRCGQDEPGWIAVDVPGRDRPASVRSSDVDTHPAVIRDGQRLVAAAQAFAGLPYLWGGRSGMGVDCSGLVQLVHQRFGITIPRDAHDQAAGGTEVAPDRALPGDIYFFAGNGVDVTHVGFAAGGDRMLHAPETGRGVELVPMPEERRRALVSARRYWA